MTEKDDGRLIKSHHPTAQLMPGPPAPLATFFPLTSAYQS